MIRWTPAEPGSLERIFKRAFREEQALGVIGQFLRRRVPIHFGGMSDPFQPIELKFRITQHFLSTLAQYEYPTVISTRSLMVASEPYLDLVGRMKSVVVQFSFVSTRAAVSRRLEAHAPDPSKLLAAMELLSKRGIPVTCRWQPYVPGVSERPSEFIPLVASAGARHVALDHLKLPVETNHQLWTMLMEGARRDLLSDYRAAGARLGGREWVLPTAKKIETVLESREIARKYNMSFGAADNDLRFLSDTSCCCSGVDQFPRFEGWFKHQIGYAVRSGTGGQILYDSIAGEWCPDGSVDRWLNSKSRIGGPGTLADHIKARWNDSASPLSPARFHGVDPSENFTASGFRVYNWTRK